MNLYDIEAFLAIANNRSVTQAANSLYVSQSTISYRLKRLEDELGVVLVMRQKGFRNISLTQKGEEFLPIARQWKSLWLNTEGFKLSNPAPFLAIASPDSINTCLLFPLYEKLSVMDNPIQMHIRTLPSAEIYAALNNDEIDVGFVFQQFRYKNVRCKPIFSDKIRMICRAEGPYGKGDIHPSSLDPKNEILLPWSNEFQNWHDMWWNPTVNPHVYVDNVTLLLSFMNNARFWAACPESVTHSLKGSPDIEVHDFSVPPPKRICYMIEQRNPKQSRIPSIEYFKTFFEPFLAQNGFTV